MGGTARGLHALKHAGIASLLGRASALVAAQAKAGIVLYLFAGGSLSMLVGNAAAAFLAALHFLADPLETPRAAAAPSGLLDRALR